MDWQERAAPIRTLRLSECVWGDLLAWEPPHRLLPAWRIDADFQQDPNLLTEVEVVSWRELAAALRWNSNIGCLRI